MAANPVFADTPLAAVAQVSAANTNRDGTGTLVDVITAGSSGSIINKVRVVAVGTTTAGVLRLYLYNGTNTRLLMEIIVQAITPSTSVPVYAEERVLDLILPSSSWKLQASTHNAETFNVFCFGGSL